MRLEATEKSDQYKVWLRDDGLDKLCRAAGGHRDDLIIQLDGYVGLCAFKIPQVVHRRGRRALSM